MDALFERGEASAADIQQAIPNPPSYSAVRAMLSKLEEKGVIEHREKGAKYIFYPVTEKKTASKSAIKRLLKTFFGGSPLAAVNALLGMQEGKLTDEELDKLEEMIDKVKQQQGKK